MATTRREFMKTMGAALAAAATGSLPAIAQAKTPRLPARPRLPVAVFVVAPLSGIDFCPFEPFMGRHRYFNEQDRIVRIALERQGQNYRWVELI